MMSVIPIHWVPTVGQGMATMDGDDEDDVLRRHCCCHDFGSSEGVQGDEPVVGQVVAVAVVARQQVAAP